MIYNVASSVASKFNSAGHLQFLACPPTVVSVGNTKPERDVSRLFSPFFEVGFKETSTHFLYRVPSSLLLIGTALRWCVASNSGIEPHIYGCTATSSGVTATVKLQRGGRHSRVKQTHEQEGVTEIGKTCFISKPAIWAHCLSSGSGCKWDSMRSPDSLANYGGIQVPSGTPRLGSRAQHNPQC